MLDIEDPRMNDFKLKKNNNLLVHISRSLVMKQREMIQDTKTADKRFKRSLDSNDEKFCKTVKTNLTIN